MACPFCGKSGKVRYRSGVGFENEVICYHCFATWDPYHVQDALEKERQIKREIAEDEARKLMDRRDWADLSGAGMDAGID